jgi:hypothetical protein
MESRRLLSASIEVDDFGVVVATGTDRNDVIKAERVGVDDVRVTVNSLSKTFDLDDVSGFRLNGLCRRRLAEGPSATSPTSRSTAAAASTR